MKGRKPVATHLKILRGNEPLPTGDLFDPPEWMSEGQKTGWGYAIENAPRGLLKKLDRSVLVTWVVSEDLHRQATGMVEKYGMLTKTPGTGAPMQSPYLPIVNKQAQIMLRIPALTRTIRGRSLANDLSG